MQNLVNFTLEDVFGTPPFALDAAAKHALYVRALSDLTRHHYQRSPEFRRIADLFGYDPSTNLAAETLPFIPVRLFKEFDLLSVPRDQVFKTMTSSGTTGQAVSKIYLDRVTAANQSKVIVKIASSFLGTKRLPFLVVDSPSAVKDRTLFSARGAGILGFAMLGYDASYLLTDRYEIDFAGLEKFQARHQDENILLFGFTSIIWEHLCQALKRAGRSLQINGILIHGGGWKKLAALAVGNTEFNATVFETTGVATVCNYYGMVEQTGSIFLECQHGVLHASIFSDLIVRDPMTLLPLELGEPGLIQLVSLLPTSYPGHSILTEDIGEIVGIDDCPCGRKGKYFRVHGRVKSAEVRGCSDTYASQQ